MNEALIYLCPSVRQLLQRGEPPSGFTSRLRRETRLQRWIHRNALPRPSVVHYFFVYLTQLQTAISPSLALLGNACYDGFTSFFASFLAVSVEAEPPKMRS
ncbi:hypothetical protein [Mastigocladopsis repens]|uniref:hypothetical protein n=1 Tax=Mastigocladopsis repens TaxID=221287 RepID=UPI000375CED4|nr:hypothetical protein [Mastigocladopsis repens]